jgi:hypothetical protein
MVTRVSARPARGCDHNAHSSERLCNDAGENTLEEESVSVVKNVETRREEEVEVKKPTRAVFTVAVHEIGYGGEVVEVERASEPRTTWSRPSFRHSHTKS